MNNWLPYLFIGIIGLCSGISFLSAHYRISRLEEKQT